MKQDMKDSGNRGNRNFYRLAAEKKKTAIAVCLITVMVFMWVRVLMRKGPQSAKAAVVAQDVNESQINPELKISFMELPKVEGRNDVLARDFFAVGSWLDFMRGGEGRPADDRREVMADEGNDNEDIVKRVTEKLRLEAIVQGENPQAFINDKLLSVGDKLVVGNGIYTYECEVSAIKENVVSIKCGETEVTLRLAQNQ
ncbi:MAG: hypothetical protein PHQ35_06090 [Phycisphaerae bacterium]|nr:hypothetical protein [Phycisphaerae bacterium]MDD5381251.1 hypothetical protein [Phycisphaerae bacterium]